MELDFIERAVSLFPGRDRTYLARSRHRIPIALQEKFKTVTENLRSGVRTIWIVLVLKRLLRAERHCRPFEAFFEHPNGPTGVEVRLARDFRRQLAQCFESTIRDAFGHPAGPAVGQPVPVDPLHLTGATRPK